METLLKPAPNTVTMTGKAGVLAGLKGLMEMKKKPTIVLQQITPV
jgi:hypothetical protein